MWRIVVDLEEKTYKKGNPSYQVGTINQIHYSTCDFAERRGFGVQCGEP